MEFHKFLSIEECPKHSFGIRMFERVIEENVLCLQCGSQQPEHAFIKSVKTRDW